jgi:hypothetical protein
MNARIPMVAAAAAAVLVLWLLWSGDSGSDLASVRAGAVAGGEAAYVGQPWRRPALLGRLSAEAVALRTWAVRYGEAAELERSGMVAEGVRLAQAHRQVLARLIPLDPRQALAEALPVLLRQHMPEEVLRSLEERVSGEGGFGVLCQGGGSDGRKPLRRVVTLDDGREYEAHVYGRRSQQRTMERTVFHGIAIDGQLALSHEPVRWMDAGEVIPEAAARGGEYELAGQMVKTGARPAVVSRGHPAVEAAGRIIPLAEGGHAVAMAEGILAREGTAGGPVPPSGPVPRSWTEGVRTVLVIRASFPDQPQDPQSDLGVYGMMKSVNDFFMESSRGRLALATTVSPLIQLPKPAAWYAVNDSASALKLLADARAAAAAAGFDWKHYDLEVVRYDGASGGFNGQAYIGSRGCWLKQSNVMIAAHELSHNLGLWHANFWFTGGESVAGSGSNEEYGHVFETMGNVDQPYPFAAPHLAMLQWLPGPLVAGAGGSGAFRIHAIDSPGFPDPGLAYALKVRKDPARDYWLEFRQPKSRYPASFSDGAMVSWGPWGDSYNPTTAWGSNGGAQMLDMTPGSPDGKNDSILLPGRTWADEDAGLTVTVLGKGRTVPESLDVVVQRGPFHGNRVPVVRIESAGPTVAVGAAAMFRAVASDPDGDPVVYAWDFGNGAYGPNQAEVSRTWPTAGRYSVRCTVSDMKGGAASAVVPVTVGATAELVVSGAVRGPSGEPLRGIRVSGSQTGSPTRMTESDSDGRYWLSGLIPGAVTVRAVDPLWSFTASSAMPMTLSGDVAALDFAAVRRPALEVSLKSGDCGEGGPAGVVRFTRRHMPLSGPLEFRIYAGGSAGLEDCDFLPAEVVDAGNLKFTIPSGQEFLDVRVQAVDDAEAEGPETVELHLLDGVGYVPQGLATATVTLGDNDSEQPLVSLRVTGDTAAEGGEAAGIAVRRTGSVASALVVNLQWQGSAEEGRDFLVEPSPVVIPAGDASAVVRVRAIQDEESEGLEDAVVSVAPAAHYLRSRTEGAAALVLRDDDLPMVSLTVPDASASEAGRDPGIILISRSGSTRQPLEVGYALGGSAMHGIDYAALSGSVTIPAGSASAAVTVVPVDDAMGELADTVVLHLVSAPGYGVGGVATGTVTISDDDLPRIEVVVQDGSVAETGDAGVFRLVARGSGNGSVAVKYALSGTAVAGVDYAALPGVINVPVGGVAELVVTPLQDTESEDGETVVLNLLEDPAWTLAVERSAMIEIADDEKPGVAVHGEFPEVNEEAGSLRFWVRRRASSSVPLTVPLVWGGTAVAGQDYSGAPATATIPPGAAGVWVTVSLTNDTAAEGAETLVLSVGPSADCGVSGAPATVWIVDNDASSLASFSFAQPTAVIAESGGTAEVTVRLSATLPREASVGCIIEGGSTHPGIDHGFKETRLVFAAGERTKTIMIPVQDDGYVEGDEVLALRLVNAAGARVSSSAGVFRLTIADDDVAVAVPFVQFAAADSTVIEGSADAGMGLVLLSAPQPAPVRVNWRVTGGTAGSLDYAPGSGVLEFAPGETAKPIPLTVLDDALVESSETVVLAIEGPSSPVVTGARLVHTVTIRDNDDRIVTVTATGRAGEDGSAGAFAVKRQSVSVAQALTVNLAVGGTAQPGIDVTAVPSTVTIPAGAAEFVFSVAGLDDVLVDPDEFLRVSVLPSVNYVVGSAVSADLPVDDDERGVWLRSSDPRGAEPGKNAVLTLERTGPVDTAVTVPLVVTGTAVAGEDYATLPAGVGFAAGQRHAEVEVRILNDDVAEPREESLVALGTADGFVAGPERAVLISIADDDLPEPPAVKIVSPREDIVRLAEGAALLLEAEVGGTSVPNVPVRWSLVSGPAAVTFGDADAPATAVRFAALGIYEIRVSAGQGLLSSEDRVTVEVEQSAFRLDRLGTVLPNPSLDGSGSDWEMTSAGGGISSSTNDSGAMAWRLVQGDFTVIAKLGSVGPSGQAGPSARCGVMVRSGMEAGARHVFASATPTRLSLVYRYRDGEAGNSESMDFAVPVPRWVRIERQGNVFITAHSGNGVHWSYYGPPLYVEMPDAVPVGLAVTSGLTVSSVTASFTDFAIHRSGRTVAWPDAGPASLTVPVGELLLGGVVHGGSSGISVQWSMLSGPAPAEFRDDLDALTTVLLPVAGEYRLRLTVTDGGVQTFDDIVINATSRLEAWRAEAFGPEAGNPAVAGDEADPDADGYGNLVEYLLASDPRNPSARPETSHDITGTDRLIVRWEERADAIEVEAVPESGDDLAGWTAAGFAVRTESGAPGMVRRVAELDVSGRPRVLVQLRVRKRGAGPQTP